MINVAIHGTKGGFRLIFGEQKLFSDPSADNTKWQAIGQTSYSLMFINNSCIFSKYKIIRDVIGDKRQGTIAFSIVVSNRHKLSGANVKSIIDRISEQYCQEYIDGNNLENVQENWSFIKNIVADYENLLNANSYVEELQSGTLEPAFIYYNNDIELQEYFDKPFQEEYSGYKQIFLINSTLKNKDENPLNSLRNSNVELKDIDLNNEKYYLNNYNRINGLSITANGRQCSDGKGNNQIRAKWQVEIKYSKNDRCYEPINAAGTISDKSTEIHKYFDIKGNQIILKADLFNNPKEKEKPVTFEIKDRTGTPVKGTEIKIDNRPWAKVSESSTAIVFKGEDIIKPFNISARKESENLYLSSVSVMPENQNHSVVLTLQKHKLIKFQGNLKNGNNSQFFPDIKISIQAKNVYNQKPECDFVDDEINKIYKVTATYSHNREYFQGETEFCPQDVNQDVNIVTIELKKSIQEKQISYALDMGMHGKASAGYSLTENGDGIKVKVLTKDYIFKGFKLDKERKQGNFEGTLVAQYEKKIYFNKNRKLIAGAVAGVLLLFIGIYVLPKYIPKQPKENPLTAKQITNYIEGDSLFVETLNDYKANWKLQEQNFIIRSGGGMFGGAEKVDSTNWKIKWKSTNESIDRAIIKRELINNKNIAELLNQRYSNRQLSFKTVLDKLNKIDSDKCAEVSKQLGDVSALTLTQIAEKINEILKPNEPAKEDTPQEPKKEQNEPEQKKETPIEEEQPKEQPIPEQQKTATSNKTSEIIQYIKGSELDVSKLIEYKSTKGINQNLKHSIQLCLDFWNLDGLGTGKNANTYCKLQEKVKADNNFENSKLKVFLNKMCKEGAIPSYSKLDKKKGLK